MKAAKHEYFTPVDGMLIQTTFVPRKELMYVNLARFYRTEGWEVPNHLAERINLAINRLIKLEADNAKRNEPVRQDR